MTLSEKHEKSTQSHNCSLPNLFIAGAAKSGTTSLHEYLGQHPDVFMSKNKEPQFFIYQNTTEQDLIDYKVLFKEGGFKVVRGESSTGYMVFPGVIERIRERIDDPKFIFVLRNPIDRAYSHYWWMKGLGFEKNDFKEAFLKDLDQPPMPWKTYHGNYKYYFQYGCYAKWIRRFVDVFGHERVLVITTENLKSDPLACVNVCSKFLGISTIGNVKELVSNKSGVVRFSRAYWLFRKMLRNRRLDNYVERISSDWLSKKLKELKVNTEKARSGILFIPQSYPRMTPEQRKWVASFYKDEVSELRVLTSYNFSEWDYDFHKK